MPIAYRNGKWWWGSKGGFDTKAKALAVARAARAHGFKEQPEGENMNHDAMKNFLGVLMCGQICLRLIHWNTKSYAEHKAIGKLYDALADQTDTLAETYIGIYGRFGNIPCTHGDLPEAVSYVAELADYIQSMRTDLPNDTQLQNLVDEIAATVDQTNYLLTLE